MHTRHLALSVVALAFAAAGCGGPARAPAGPTTPAEPPPPPAYEVTRAPDLGMVAADATHVYWADDDGIWRRAHGVGHAPERLVAVEGMPMFSVGRDDVFFVSEDRLRAIPRAGGAPSELAALEDWPWALVAERDGDGVLAAVSGELTRYSRTADPRTYDLTGPSGMVTPTAATVAGGSAYVTLLDYDGGPTLVRVELASGATTPMSTLGALAETTWLAVSGDTLFAASNSQLLAVPLRGGKPQLVHTGGVAALAADAEGYALLGYGAVTAQRAGEAPRLVATSTDQEQIPGAFGVAAGGPYIYYTAYGDDGTMILRAAPRRAPIEVWRLPADSYLGMMAAGGGKVLATVARPDGLELVELGPKRPRTIATGELWLEALATDGEHVVASTGDTIQVLDRPARAWRQVHEDLDAYMNVLEIADGRAYWAAGTAVWALDLPAGTPRLLGDVGALVGDEAVFLSDLVGAGGAVYTPVVTTARLAIVRLDGAGAPAIVWEHADPSPQGLAALARLGDAWFVTDGDTIWQVPLAGGAGRVVVTARGEIFMALRAVGDDLVATSELDDGVSWGPRLVRVPLDGGAPAVLYRPHDGNLWPVETAGGAIYVGAFDLGGVLRIPAR